MCIKKAPLRIDGCAMPSTEKKGALRLFFLLNVLQVVWNPNSILKEFLLSHFFMEKVSLEKNIERQPVYFVNNVYIFILSATANCDRINVLKSVSCSVFKQRW